MTPAAPSIPTTLTTSDRLITMNLGERRVISSNILADRTSDERHAFKRLMDAEVIGESTVLSTVGRRRVGSLIIGDNVLVVRPPLRSDLFVTLVMLATDEDFSRDLKDEMPPADLVREGDSLAFLDLLAAMLVRSSERVIRRSIVRQYRSHTESLPALRGRIQMRENFGRHAANGLVCRHHVLESDVPLNRLILAGLVRASQVLSDDYWRSRAQTQLFAWQGLATHTTPSPRHFDTALQSLTRLTKHYRVPLLLAKALLYGSRAEDLLGGEDLGYALEFDMAWLFERLVQRMTAELAESAGLFVRNQLIARRAISNAEGEEYRRAIPDVCLLREHSVVAVLDAKYKPRYLHAKPGPAKRRRKRVSNADIYQMYFTSRSSHHVMRTRSRPKRQSSPL